MTAIQIETDPQVLARLTQIESHLRALADRIAPQSEYLTTTDAARILRVTEHTVRKMVREGRITCKRDGKKMLFRREDIGEKR